MGWAGGKQVTTNMEDDANQTFAILQKNPKRNYHFERFQPLIKFCAEGAEKIF